ncbi:MAG: 4-(cytidine 5'-diphospho)-2-C-methyl-D-erythritol kinase [Bacteroidales bacterium]|nr:4-(cytidine 5'-diphospho)-2-C-methyl-D-erythritol kinase [Bacteroidales bacterium]
MITFAPAKINIGLRIVNKRKDGFHNLESYLYPIPLYDIIEVLPSNTSNTSNKDELIQTGIETHTCLADNLVYKAVLKVREHDTVPPLKIHLHKQIPIQSGLGGGSSDAVATLKILNNLFSLNLSGDRMQKYAEALGSDCPFFLKSSAAKISGRGEHINPIEMSLAGKYIVVIKPDFSMSTAHAFAQVKNYSKSPLSDCKAGNFNSLTNDFENYLGKNQLIVQEVKNFLKVNGAIYTSMSGSGSAIFGLFQQKVNIRFNTAYFHWSGRLQ